MQRGRVELRHEQDDAAELAVDGETVRLVAAGLAPSSCSCPAAGICRHRLAAVVHLRSQAPADRPRVDWRAVFATMTPELIARFAGKAGWQKILSGEARAASLWGDSTRLPDFTPRKPDRKTTVLAELLQRLRAGIATGPILVVTQTPATDAVLVKSWNNLLRRAEGRDGTRSLQIADELDRAGFATVARLYCCWVDKPEADAALRAASAVATIRLARITGVDATAVAAVSVPGPGLRQQGAWRLRLR